MNNLGRLIIAFTAVILIILFPLPYAAQIQNENMDGHVENYTKELSDNIRQKGYLDKSTYESFVNRLDATGELYDIDIEDIHPVTGEEISSAKASVGFLNASVNSEIQSDFENKSASYMDLKSKRRNILNLLSLKNTILHPKADYLDQIKDQIKKNSDSIEDAKIYSLNSHTHTDDCYGEATVYQYEYTGGAQTFTAPEAGNYILEVYGAQGGGLVGGLGGYAKGTKYLNAGDTLQVNVGAQGSGNVYERTLYNGSRVSESIGMGGGATDISTTHKAYASFDFVNLYGREYLHASGMGIGEYQLYIEGSAGLDGLTYPYIYTNDLVLLSSGDRFINCNPPTTIARAIVSKIRLNQNYNDLYISLYPFTSASFNKVEIHSMNADERYIVAGGGGGSGYTEEWGGQGTYNIVNVTGGAGGGPEGLGSSDNYGNSYTVTQSTGYAKRYGGRGGGGGYFGGYGGSSFSMNWGSSGQNGYRSGGGGSGYVGGVNNGSMQTGVRSGNGYARITQLKLLCDQVVTSITATNPVQTVKQGEAIISTAIATMLDGSTKTVNCSVSGYDSNQIGTQTATLTYSGLVGNAKTYGTRTCSVNVTVLNPKLLSYITVSPSQQTIGRNGTPSFTVTAYYSDGTSAVLNTSQYTRNSFDSTIGGPHTITFAYTENGITKTATAIVYVDELIAIYATPTNPVVERYTDNLPLTVTAEYRYSGKRNVPGGYVLDGYSPSKLGEQDVTLSYTDSGITQSVKLKVTVTVLHRTCPRCGTTYDFNPDDSDPGCPHCRKTITSIQVTPEELEVTQGQSLPVTVRATYADGSSEEVYGWTSNYDSNKTGIQLVTIQYGGYADEITVWVNEKMITCPVCGKEYQACYSNCPYCAKKLVGINVTPNDITVTQYATLNLEVTALYADGSSEAVTEWSIDTTTSRPGSYEATVRYKTVSAKIKLTVISATAVICPICGTSYEPADNPRGCPVCSGKLTGIEAYLTNGSNKVQLGTMPDITVVLLYLDTHREIVTEGYTIENYTAEKMGKQNIIVHYDKFTYTLEIEVVNTLASIICPNGHVYYRNEDGTDPGCPYCNKKDSVGTVAYYDITYLDEILDTIYSGNAYYFKSGNYITVKVIKKDKSLLTKVQNMFLQTAALGRKREFTYGGEVL